MNKQQQIPTEEIPKEIIPKFDINSLQVSNSHVQLWVGYVYSQVQH